MSSRLPRLKAPSAVAPSANKGQKHVAVNMENAGPLAKDEAMENKISLRSGVKRKASEPPSHPADKVNESTNNAKRAKSAVAAVTASSRQPLRAAIKAAASKPTPAATTATKSKTAGAASTKRPAWDVKGRLQDLEEKHTETIQKLLSSNEDLGNMTSALQDSQLKIQELLDFRTTLESQLQEKTVENSTAHLEVEKLKQEMSLNMTKHSNEVQQLNHKHTLQIQDMTTKHQQTLAQLESVSNELSVLKAENQSLKEAVSSQSHVKTLLESDLRVSKIQLESTETTLRGREDKISQLEKDLADALADVSLLESKVREGEMIRRKLHNTIQELKGNIRVFCRVRPLLDGEKDDAATSGGVTSQLIFPEDDENAIQVEQSLLSADSLKTQSKSYPFAFDKIFKPTCKQAEVFEEISQLVQSALDGYNVSIFAYGQTGSGKTFTMEGPDYHKEDEEFMGMIPRAVRQIFLAGESLKDKGWQYKMEAQFVEIYNETIRDLLAPNAAQNVGKKHDIKHDASTGETTVTEANLVEVTSPTEVFTLLKRAGQNRAVASTNCNERSSRSHSVFTMRIEGVNTVTDDRCVGHLNLIDLAGSERLSSSGSTGDRLKETQAINKSLSSLGDVIAALAKGDGHIPYRNSKLTYLLQNSLGGNSKTLMFVNVSPLSASIPETLCSLRFATKVNSCQIGTAKRNTK